MDIIKLIAKAHGAKRRWVRTGKEMDLAAWFDAESQLLAARVLQGRRIEAKMESDQLNLALDSMVA